MALLSSTLLLRTHSLTLLTCAYYLLTSPTSLLSSTPIWLLGESMSVRPAGYALEITPNDASTRMSKNTNVKGRLAGQGRGTGQPERELFAFLALVVVVYAVTQFLFAGDLSMLQSTAATTAPSSSSTQAASSRGTGVSSPRNDSPAKSPSRYAEELHTLLTAQSRWLTLSAIHVLASSTLVFWIYMFHSHSASESSSATTPVGLAAAVEADELALLRAEERDALALEAAAEADEDTLAALLAAEVVAPPAVLDPDTEDEEVALPLDVEVQVADAGCRRQKVQLDHPEAWTETGR
ncbi:uncharacterized protein Z519_04450 [Cladophialophora bantiana CBS 173.52]|uniref:Uncharacterized protein n=1 Tax=Cladophialophora bantiana (strain ATCC 10958 / CBS 173.52 / CDC B-1940 / NIH 8579) TaxID=1442370 RepID=A0A0D2ICG6_CLAB1|nr:uncharacterized protein Z519_04450 [Cladophialophora bantiana CBS 173.52]KIW94474.1 hypothetical protein Z519_04450 [Cladophialophora bantiana CBS 173.52]